VDKEYTIHMQITIRVDGLEDIKQAFSRFPDTVGPFLRTAATKSAFAVEGEAKKGTPVDTGRLRASIATSLGIASRGLGSVVQTNVYYAIYVHEGTRYMRGRPYMQQGAEAASGKIEQYYKEEIEKALNLVGK